MCVGVSGSFGVVIGRMYLVKLNPDIVLVIRLTSSLIHGLVRTPRKKLEDSFVWKKRYTRIVYWMSFCEASFLVC